MLRQINEILSLDPLVSDTACQNRVVALLVLSRKISKGGKLTEEEDSFIEACSLLSMTKDVELIPGLGLIGKEVTDNKKIPDKYFAGVAVISNKMRNKLLARKKREVAEMALQIMKANCNVQFDQGFMFYNQTASVIKLEGESIPVLPVYVTAKMLLQYINRENIPVLINMKRLLCDKDTKQVTKIGEAYFCYEQGSIKPASVELLQGKSDDGAIVFAMMSQISNKVRQYEKYLTQQNFDDFRQVFQEQDFNLLVMLCAAAHSPYPKKIIYNQLDPLSETVRPVLSPQMQRMSLNDASMEEYRALAGMARQFGFFKNRVAIDHISTSTIGNCQQRIKELAL